MSQSKYRGVCYDSSEAHQKKWKARINHNNVRITLGRFATEEEAARAVDAKSKELYGEKARLNIPDTQPTKTEDTVTIRWHPLAEAYEYISGEEWDAFKASVAASKGNDTPVEFRRLKDGTKEYIDGRNRMRACDQLNLACREQEVILDDDEVEPHISKRNDMRRHTTPEGRKKLAKYHRATGKSHRAIAAILGVSAATIARDLGEDSGAPNEAPEKITGRDGKSYSANGKHREPGGDTKGLNRGGHKKDGPKNGSAKFDWSAHYSGPMARLVRGVDELFRAYGNTDPDKPIRDPQHAGILRLLDEAGKGIKALYKRLKGEEAPE